MVIPVYDKNPVRRTPVVTYALIALCVVVFLLGPISGFNPSYGTGDQLQCAQAVYFDRWGVIPAELFHGQLPLDRLGLPAGCPAPHTFTKMTFPSVLTAMFVHGSWLHLIGNMLFLYVFGDNVESRMGRFRYLLFFLAAGYLATYGFALAGADSTQTLVGASGAISGALGAYLYLYPKARVTSLFPFLFFVPLRFPAWMVLGFWFALQWLAAQTSQSGPGVAYLAHVVGFVFGFLAAVVCFRRSPKLETAARATQGDLQP
ncbi:rhomboid family intramembrane serine protease [Streptomyces sp. SID13666]|uniref:rhomboid family intramembrane serine protease n=1 Tax=unclassified Streptomyces TaxID=2593676 RepID=UPI0013BED43F|nr:MULTISPECIES: rhomboid family intramembrane serine protease [unclassified Streptomyces]NEA58652.1 rhomboid family intramembrane serine protease [Streptomyces sp. SID13666]NEA74638.1 rhomboid family intramembrane serine protease [Streptomyces sp. SID13588]